MISSSLLWLHYPPVISVCDEVREDARQFAPLCYQVNVVVVVDVATPFLGTGNVPGYYSRRTLIAIS